jgi:Fe-S-cluster containining protein
VWETPRFSPVTDLCCRRFSPEMPELNNHGTFYSVKIDSLENELFYCPFLDREKGCKLGDEKPFECGIWPFRVLKFRNAFVIAVSPLCKAVFDMPLSELTEFVRNELLKPITEYVRLCPEIVKEYDMSYVILSVIDFEY